MALQLRGKHHDPMTGTSDFRDLTRNSPSFLPHQSSCVLYLTPGIHLFTKASTLDLTLVLTPLLVYGNHLLTSLPAFSLVLCHHLYLQARLVCPKDKSYR